MSEAHVWALVKGGIELFTVGAYDWHDLMRHPGLWERCVHNACFKEASR